MLSKVEVKVIHISYCLQDLKQFQMYGNVAKALRVRGSQTGCSNLSCRRQCFPAAWNRIIIPSNVTEMAGSAHSTHRASETVHRCTKCTRRMEGVIRAPRVADRGYCSTRHSPPVGHVCYFSLWIPKSRLLERIWLLYLSKLTP